MSKSSMMVPGKSSTTHSNRPQSTDKSKSELSTSPVKKVSISEKAISDKILKPLSKTFLSKSHDNLASTLRRRAITQHGNPRPQSDDKRPMSVTPREKSASPGKQGKFKVPSAPGGTPIRKASSTQSVDRAGTVSGRERSVSSPIKKASSIQNINKTPATVRRVSSSQSITREKAKHRISAPSNVMAYNAELLANFEKEKRNLEGRISELIQIAECRKADIEKYKFEVRQLKENVEEISASKEKVDVLQHENKLLKDRLHELGIPVEQITDTEKLSLLKSSKPAPDHSNHVEETIEYQGAACATPERGPQLFVENLLHPEYGSEISLGEYTCHTPEHPSCLSMDNGQWEKQSNKSSDALSEISVACLQDRIVQMEETHYSTSEELQATLQELGDLQDAVNELTSDNERFADEKSILLESLCTQTEKLEKCRTQIEHLKALLLSDMGNGDRTDRECQLVELLKSAQEEREELMLKQHELNNALYTTDNDNREMQDIVTALKDKILLLEDRYSILNAEKKAMEFKITDQSGKLENDGIEMTRMKKLLASEKAKIEELEQARKAEDKSDLEELLDKMRQEKEKAEIQVSDAQERLSFSSRETGKLKEQLSRLERELSAAHCDQNTEIDELLLSVEKLDSEKVELQQQSETLRDHIDQLEVDNDRYLEEKKSFGATLADLQSELSDRNKKVVDLEEEIDERKGKYDEEMSDLKQFQKDLQTAVVIANNIKTETQEDMDKVQEHTLSLMDQNKLLKLEIRKLEGEMDRLYIQSQKGVSISASELQKRMMPNVDKELSLLRQGNLRLCNKDENQNQSVKTLIRSLEDQVKGTPSKSSSTSSSRRSSLDSIKTEPLKSPPPCDRRSSAPSDSPLKSALRKPLDASIVTRHSVTSIIYEDQQPSVTDDIKSTPSPCRSDTDGTKVALSILTNKTQGRRNSVCEQEKKDPLVGLVKQTGGSKRNALLKWCQHKTHSYTGIDITNFSSSWNDGLAFCALLHSYMPDKIPFADLISGDKRRNITLAFKAAESVGVFSTLDINDICSTERPDWMTVMGYVTSIYKHFEVDAR